MIFIPTKPANAIFMPGNLTLMLEYKEIFIWQITYFFGINSIACLVKRLKLARVRPKRVTRQSTVTFQISD